MQGKLVMVPITYMQHAGPGSRPTSPCFILNKTNWKLAPPLTSYSEKHIFPGKKPKEREPTGLGKQMLSILRAAIKWKQKGQECGLQLQDGHHSSHLGSQAHSVWEEIPMQL